MVSVAKYTTRVDEAIDRALDRRMALGVAALWGLAEATFFFIVPDLWLTAVGVRGWRRGLKAVIAALAGALVGGSLMFSLGARHPEQMRDFLTSIPAISPFLVADVERQIGEIGAVAILIGPLRGTPYKILAVEWGAAGRGVVVMLIVSVLARGGRFLLSVAVARLLGWAGRWMTQRRVNFEWGMLAIIWIVFYTFYFSRFGW